LTGAKAHTNVRLACPSHKCDGKVYSYDHKFWQYPLELALANGLYKCVGKGYSFNHEFGSILCRSLQRTDIIEK